MSKPADRIPQLIREWSEIASGVLVDAGIDAEQAAELGMRIVRRQCDEYAGLNFYMPIWTAQHISDRDRLIADAAAAGADIEALSTKYKLHKTTIYAIIRRVTGFDQADRQGGLFAADDI